MKRTNVVIDEKLLEQAVRLTGERTYSATINRALRDLVRVSNLEQGLKILGGSNAWEGDLEVMRRGRGFDLPGQGHPVEMVRDAPVPVKRPKRKARRGSR